MISRSDAKYAALACARTMAAGANLLLRAVKPLRRMLHAPTNGYVRLASAEDPTIHVHNLEPARSFHRCTPRTIGDLAMPMEFERWRDFEVQPTFVAEADHGQLWGSKGGVVFSATGHLVLDLSKDQWSARLHRANVQTQFPRAVPLAGRALSLVTPDADSNYYHWTLDLLTRARLLSLTGQRVQDFDHYLVNDRNKAFQRDGLKNLGIDPTRVRHVDDRSLYTADQLVVPAIRHENTAVSPEDIEFLRELHRDDMSQKAPFRRLYLTRCDAPHRRLENEDALIPLLKRFGFEVIVAARLSVAEQVRAFSEAAIIAGPHGAAFTNLAFATRGCQVIEFLAPEWIVPYTWTLCSHAGLDYWPLVGERDPTHAPSDFRGRQARNLRVDPAKLETVLKASS